MRGLRPSLPHALIPALVLALGLLSAAPCRAAQQPAVAAGRGECQTIRSAILAEPVPYCVLLPASYDAQKDRRYPVLYFLHGLGDNEQTFLSSGAWNLVQDLWQRHELGEFLIVTPRGGSSFYINSRDGRRRYEDFLLREFLPAIEARYRIRSGREFRGVAGISMGGYGALRLAFRHPELFGSVSTISAAVVEKLPDVAVSSSLVSGPLRLLGDVFGSPLDRAFYDANNPLTLARTADLSRLKIYFDCGTEDDYGFNAGAQKLHDILLSRHIPHEFHLYPGGHNWLYFAEHLPAALEFESRAFGLPATAGQVGKAGN
jgi:S-formylglutathione hydrolase FrmB